MGGAEDEIRSYELFNKNMKKMIDDLKNSGAFVFKAEVFSLDEESFCENNINKPIIAAYCYNKLLKLNKEKAIKLIEENKEFIGNDLLSSLIDLNWVRDFMANGVRIIVNSYRNKDIEHQCMELIIDDYRTFLAPSQSIIEKLDNYSEKNIGEPSLFMRTFEEDLKVLDEFKHK
jgi:hypothetical protein